MKPPILVLIPLCVCGFVNATTAAVNNLQRNTTAGPASTNSFLSIGTLLDRYAESQQVFSSFILQFEMTQRATRPAKGARQTLDAGEKVELRYDGRRAKLIKKQWGYVDAYSTNRAKEKAQPQFWMWDGKAYYNYGENHFAGRSPRLMVNQGMSEARIRFEFQGLSAKNIIRFENLHVPCDMRHDRDFLEQALRRAKPILVRPTRENIGGSLCYVIEANLPSVKHAQLEDKSWPGASLEGAASSMSSAWVAAARHTIWLDPDHGYHIAKAVSVYSKPFNGKMFSLRITRENVRFAQMDGVWLPIQMDDTREESGTATPFQGYGALQDHFLCAQSRSRGPGLLPARRRRQRHAGL